MKDLLPGWKTNINTIILALIPILGLVGIQVDPDAVTQWIDEFSVALQALFALLAGTGVWFRQLGKR